jgi:hypothetical protein
VDELPDGRTKYWVDEILKDITPKRVDQIDEEAVTTTWFENGIAIGHLDHEMEAVPGGMRLVHVMYVPYT